MRKILTIAIREYKAMVGTKAFMISIIMMPVLMLGSLFVMQYLQNSNQVRERRIAVIDHTGSLSELIQSNAQLMAQQIEERVDRKDESLKPQLGRMSLDKYVIELIDPETVDDGLRLRLSDRIRSQALYAFVEIPAAVLKRESFAARKPDEALSSEAPTNASDQNIQQVFGAGAIATVPAATDEMTAPLASDPSSRDTLLSSNSEASADSLTRSKSDTGLGPNNDASAPPAAVIRFYSQDASLSEARSWLATLINQELRNRRLLALDIDPAQVETASRPVNVIGMGLVEEGLDGSMEAKVENDPVTAIFLPLGVMMLMFMVIFMAAQPMLESVLEEKSQRIAEVLLGSANAFQLMLGKLFGTVAGSLTVFAIYLIGMYGFASYRGFAEQIPFQLAPWFILFQVMGVLFYASIFMAIGASVSQLKEAQSLLLPVWMLMMSPMFVWLVLVQDPMSPTAVYFSMFPPAAPTAMMLRLATGQAIPMWQPWLSAFLTAASTLFIVYVAARIFRVGILWQGKTPRLAEIIKWAFKG